MDFCGPTPSRTNLTQGRVSWQADKQYAAWKALGDALNESGRPICAPLFDTYDRTDTACGCQTKVNVVISLQTTRSAHTPWLQTRARRLSGITRASVRRLTREWCMLHPLHGRRSSALAFQWSSLREFRLQLCRAYARKCATRLWACKGERLDWPNQKLAGSKLAGSE